MPLGVWRTVGLCGGSHMHFGPTTISINYQTLGLAPPTGTSRIFISQGSNTGYRQSIMDGDRLGADRYYL